MKKILIVCLLFVTGCAPVLVASNPRSVLIGNSSSYNAAEAFQLAENECVKYNRHAVAIPDNVPDGQETYECKD